MQPQNLVQPRSDTCHILRQIEDFTELPVPADELHLLVENRDAFAYMLERGLQNFSVVMDRGIGIVEQAQRRTSRDVALAKQQRQHEARR